MINSTGLARYAMNNPKKYKNLALRLYNIIKQPIRIKSCIWKDISEYGHGEIRMYYKKERNNYKQTMFNYLNSIDSEVICMLILQYDPSIYHMYYDEQWHIVKESNLLVFNFIKHFVDIEARSRNETIIGRMDSLLYAIQQLEGIPDEDELYSRYERVYIYSYTEPATKLYSRILTDVSLTLDEAEDVYIRYEDDTVLKRHLRYELIPRKY